MIIFVYLERENNDQQSQSKKMKRVSKFKEAKQAALKRIRQRYDSQTDTPIVNVAESKQASSSSESSSLSKKPILNKNGQIVYSKFDFTADKTIKTANSKKQHDAASKNVKPKDYKNLLKKLKQKKEKIEELKKSGETEKANELEFKDKLKSAIDRAAGIKVKDNPELLAKAVKRIEKKKDKSRKGWDERVKSVEARKQIVQDKRRKNLEKRKEKNKEKKIKKLKKKGRILMGF